MFTIKAYSDNKTSIEFVSSPITEKTNVRVSQLTKPSLGSLGIKTEINDFMGLDIWDNLEASSIIKNLNYIPDVVTSKSLQSFLNKMYLSTSNPPNGNSEDIVKFLETRLLKIKSSGQSEKLYKLVQQLPESNRWEFWKKWQIEFELFNIKDKEACEYINEKSKKSSDDFWQMGRVFCLIIDGKRNQSEFVLDLIKSRGFSDKIFEELFYYVYNKKKNIEFKTLSTQIEPIHIVMMESLKLPIEMSYVAHFGIEYTDSLLSLNYLTPKARSFLLDRKINFSEISIETVIDNYKSVADGNIGIETALLNYVKEPNGYNRANVWLEIITMKDELKKAESILNFVKMEIKNGRFNDVVKLYLPILKDIDSSTLTKDIIDAIEELKITSNPSAFPKNDLANMILLKRDHTWDFKFILKEKAWHLIPFIERAGMIQPSNINWLNYINTIDRESYEDKNAMIIDSGRDVKKIILTKSIQQASNSNQKSLTVLLIARLIGDTSIIDFDLNDLITIKIALNKIGLENLSNSITYEIMSSKIISF